MALLLKNNAVFLHIPKTGGNWVRKVLEQQKLIKREIGHKHCDIDRVLYDPYLTVNPIRSTSWVMSGRKPTYPQPYTFCFVRHPIAWYESWFNYMTKRGWNDWPHRKGPIDWHPCAPLNKAANTDFRIFIYNIITQQPGYVTQLYSWYTKRGVTYVGKQESLVEDMIRILIDMKVDFNEQEIRDLSPINVSSSSTNSLSWDSQLQDEILKLEHSVLRQYKYATQTVS
ncbi:hypothetical protein JD969_17390 [Planctomycetota bacterium]|nr:hypothetical protein JD969_17390 [Planctomycetota bacterium]